MTPTQLASLTGTKNRCQGLSKSTVHRPRKGGLEPHPIPRGNMYRYVLVGFVIVGCGDTFESQSRLEGQNDGQAGTSSIETGTIESDAGSDSYRPLTDAYTVDSSATDLGDSSPIEAGFPGNGDTGNDASPEAETGVTCDPWQCQTTCASQGKLCSECECV